MTVTDVQAQTDRVDGAWFAEVRELARARDAVLLAHNYQLPEIQDVAHHTGDSLALSRIAAESSASTIVFCGVHFMAETAKILAPDKTVLIPDARAGCSLADSITADELRAWKAEHPGAVVVSYVNTTAAVKAETDICCTSSNAVEVVASIPADREVLFLPDQFLGAHVRRTLERGRTCTSGRGSATCTRASTAPSSPRRSPRTPTPSCSCTPSAAARPRRSTSPAAARSPPTGSRSSRPAGCSTPPARRTASSVLVATEVGMLHQLRRAAPEIDFRAVNERASCRYMKMITPEALLRSLRDGTDEVHVDPELAARGRAAVQRMIAIGRPGGAASDTRAPRPACGGPGGARTSSSSAAASPASPPRSTPPRPGLRVVVVTKDAADAGSTRWAQGGVAVVVGDVPGDSVDAHVADTLTAGAGLCDAAAVASILADGPAAVARLRARGAVFDTTPAGRPGAHPRGRALGVPGGPGGRRRHRRRDRAGARRRRPRGRRAAADRARRRRRAARTDAGSGPVAGVTVLDDAGRPGLLRAPAVLLATGGYGQLFASTTNPATATGDGVALALRAGATAADLEFVQFHPTVLYLPGGARAAAAGHRGRPRRGRRAARPHRGPVHGRRAPAGRAGPARRRRRRDHPADGRDRHGVRLARRHRRRRLRRPLRWPVASTQTHMSAAASRKRHSTDISGATTPSCARIPIQLTPHRKTVAT